MKQIHLCLIFMVLSVLNANSISAQLSINCHIDISNDTAVSIYDLSKYNIGFSHSVKLPDEYLKRNDRNSYFEVKFPGFDWRPFQKQNSFMKYSTLYSGSMHLFVSFAHFILTNDTLTTLWKNGDIPLQVRYKYEVLYRGEISTYYSNIDTLIIPRANEHDVEGSVYLKNSENLTLLEITNMYPSTNYEEYDQLIHIRNAFPNSFLSELARLLMVSYDASLLIEPIDYGYKVPPAVKAMIRSAYNSLSNSKSEYIRYDIKEYNDFMQAQPD